MVGQLAQQRRMNNKSVKQTYESRCFQCHILFPLHLFHPCSTSERAIKFFSQLNYRLFFESSMSLGAERGRT